MLLYMEAPKCSIHQPALAYGINDNVCYCAKCVHAHETHDIASIDELDSARNIHSHVTLIQDKINLLDKVEKRIHHMLLRKAIWICISWVCSSHCLRCSLIKIQNESLENKELGNHMICGFEKVLNTVCILFGLIIIS